MRLGAPANGGFGAAGRSGVPCAPRLPRPPGPTAEGQPGSRRPGWFPAPATARGWSRRFPQSPLRAWGSPWAPEEVAGGMGRGGSLGTTWEWDRGPASRRRTPEPGDPAIDSNREAAVYSNTAPPGPSPGDAARPGAPSSRPGRPPSSLPRGLGLPARGGRSRRLTSSARPVG